ncbi:MAG: hypothetical protein WBS20_13445 [Lysobacterales bacterium]
MSKIVELLVHFLRTIKVFSVCLVVVVAQLSPVVARAHPLEYHLEPLDAETIERVLTSFELLTQELQAAGLLASAKLPKDAMGVTALLWSLEDAVAAMDESPAVESPSLLNALTAAGYESSPYVVAEWKMEAERVLESYEVLSGNIQSESIFRQLTELEETRGELTEEEIEQRESTLTRQMSMLQTTAADVAQVAPYRQRLDMLTGRLKP